MDTLADGRHVVFVPGVPKALVGTLHIMAADRVQIAEPVDSVGTRRSRSTWSRIARDMAE